MRDRCRLYASLLILWIAASPRARALLTFNDGKDLVSVNADYTYGYDSNVFTQNVARGSSTETYSFGANYSRRAGLIAVSAAADLNFGNFGQFASQDYVDPSYTLSFTKGTGRTTGSLAFSAQRTDQPDPDANDRAIAWNYGAALNLKYPVNDRYYFTNTTDYNNILYTNRTLFTNLGSLTDGIDLNYIFDSKLNFNGGYTFGLSQTDNTTDYDHSLTFGANGSLLPKLTGSISGGYEERHSDYAGTAANYGSLTANAALSWRYSHLLTFTTDINKGFGTSSTDVSLDTTSVSLDADVNVFHRLRTSFITSLTGTDFLGALGAGRRDRLWQSVANLGTSVTTHIQVNLAYAYMINYSNVGDAAFTRQTLSLALSASY